MKFDISIGKTFGNALTKTGNTLSSLDKRYLWAKYVLVSLFAFSAIVFGDYTIMDYVKLQTRGQLLQSEINKLEPKLQEDSLRLDELRHLGRGTEAIAREKYLMKAPGEQIFLITPDSINQQDNNEK